ncbi:MAG: element excision factor XisI family protein [Caldilineaceae bacterium]
MAPSAWILYSMSSRIIMPSCSQAGIGVRVRGNLIYITLHNDKVYIEYDGIEQGIVHELIKRGVPEEKIVLAFLEPRGEADLVAA